MDGLKEIQKMTMDEMKRLNNDEHMKEYGKEEVARANALSQNATVYIKTINVTMRIEEMKQNYNITIE